jgi:sugar phosphate isomerase/epimerase
LFGETLRDRANLLRRTGFDGIELGHEWMDLSADEIRSQIGDLAVSAIVGSIMLLDPDAGERRRALEIDRERLRKAKALEASAVVEVPTFGANKFPDLSPLLGPWELERELLVTGLKELAPDVRASGVNLILEPLNRYETHFLNRQEQGAEICRAVGGTGFKLLSDLFHMHIEERSIPGAIRAVGPHIGYVHIADSNRKQPGAGFTDFSAIFSALKETGYDGWLVIESGADKDIETALYESSQLLRQLWKDA